MKNQAYHSMAKVDHLILCRITPLSEYYIYHLDYYCICISKQYILMLLLVQRIKLILTLYLVQYYYFNL